MSTFLLQDRLWQLWEAAPCLQRPAVVGLLLLSAACESRSLLDDPNAGRTEQRISVVSDDGAAAAAAAAAAAQAPVVEADMVPKVVSWTPTPGGVLRDASVVEASIVVKVPASTDGGSK